MYKDAVLAAILCKLKLNILKTSVCTNENAP